jgi:3-hydroxyacyl-[acyl-carrier-protein] dehydratase
MILTKEQILELIPQQKPFRFIDTLEIVNDDCSKGSYTFREDEYFYQGHFPTKPVTPGVIVVESMAQIGLVSLGIHLLSKSSDNFKSNDLVPVFTSSNVDFLSPIFPGEKLTVKSEKIYFRFGKLKVKIVATKDDGSQVCKGEFSGMFVNQNKL